MGQLRISPENLRHAADEFRLANKDAQRIVLRLEKVASGLQEQWSGVTQELFFREYKDWLTSMGGFLALLTGIANEMQAMAERFDVADR